MLNNINTNTERIIAKFDNDFNPDNSDWIPRIGAWTIDAMSQINALRKTRKKVRLTVHDNIAYSERPINSPTLIVTDANGCKIVKQESSANCDCTSSTGKLQKICDVTPYTVDAVYNPDGEDYDLVAETVNVKDVRNRHDLHTYSRRPPRSYVLIDDNKLELNYSTNHIYVETEVVVTEYSNAFNCELPVIPNVGKLIEYIVYFCMYKMLCRGYKHPVFNLGASQYGTNPYYEYNKLEPIAKRAVIIDEQGNFLEEGDDHWRSAFWITTFG